MQGPTDAGPQIKLLIILVLAGINIIVLLGYTLIYLLLECISPPQDY